MKPFTFAVFVVGIAVLGNVNALTEEEVNKIQTVLIPYVAECGKQYIVSEDVLNLARETGSVGTINPCLLGCVFKKINVINDKGLFDPIKSEEVVKKTLPNAEDQSKGLNVVKSCISVNDKDVSDGTEGCERGKLLFDCIMPFRTQFL